MSNLLFSYTKYLEDKKNSDAVYKLISQIVEQDLVFDEIKEENRKILQEIINLKENKIAEIIKKGYIHLF